MIGNEKKKKLERGDGRRKVQRGKVMFNHGRMGSPRRRGANASQTFDYIDGEEWTERERRA